MNVSLDQAIEIHARALRYRFGNRAALVAEEKSHHCAARGDNEGRAVWQRVAAVAGTLLDPTSQRPSVDEAC